MNYTNRADLFEAVAKSIRMQEAAGIDPSCKFEGNLFHIKSLVFSKDNFAYEFPLCVIGKRPVFINDTLYFHNTIKIQVKGAGSGIPLNGLYVKLRGFTCEGDYYHECYSNECSWNPPKPKTVMVELLAEDAEWYAEYNAYDSLHDVRIGEACHKALEEMK